MRRLVAALACRVNGARLYGKPLQLLDIDGQMSILQHQINLLRQQPEIDQIVLGVSEGVGNQVFFDVARAAGITAIEGDERDVLRRLIQCADAARASDVFRVTTESPFPYFEAISEAWHRHLIGGNDLTVIDGVPEGSHFEIYTREALERSHRLGDARHRSEMCSLYVREHRQEFAVAVVPVPAVVERLDLRLTVDYPEDLIVCRAVYAALKAHAPRIPLAEIVSFLDRRPDLKRLVDPFVQPLRLYPDEERS